MHLSAVRKTHTLQYRQYPKNLLRLNAIELFLLSPKLQHRHHVLRQADAAAHANLQCQELGLLAVSSHIEYKYTSQVRSILGFMFSIAIKLLYLRAKCRRRCDRLRSDHCQHRQTTCCRCHHAVPGPGSWPPSEMQLGMMRSTHRCLEDDIA